MLALLDENVPLEEISSSESDEDELPRQCISHEAMIKLNEMRVNNQLCDAAIRTDRGDVFNVHRAIMCACSEYFK
jgi:BTB/POZ domain